MRTYCDQSTNGGGWNVIQRRFSGEETFDRGWKDYKEGFGNLNREMWLGNDLVHNITAKNPLQLLVEITRNENQVAIDSYYGQFSISNEDSHYSLSVSGSISGNLHCITIIFRCRESKKSGLDSIIKYYQMTS